MQQNSRVRRGKKTGSWLRDRQADRRAVAPVDGSQSAQKTRDPNEKLWRWVGRMRSISTLLPSLWSVLAPYISFPLTQPIIPTNTQESWRDYSTSLPQGQISCSISDLSTSPSQGEVSLKWALAHHITKVTVLTGRNIYYHITLYKISEVQISYNDCERLNLRRAFLFFLWL